MANHPVNGQILVLFSVLQAVALCYQFKKSALQRTTH